MGTLQHRPGFARLARVFDPGPRRARVVYFDGDCGVCFAIVRLLGRLDAFGRLRFVPNREEGALSSTRDRALLDRTIVVESSDPDCQWTRAAAFAQIFAALPLGWPVSVLLRLPGVSQLAALAYDAFAANRTRISTWLGLTACAVPLPGAQSHRRGSG